jgi:hypothetical protein
MEPQTILRGVERPDWSELESRPSGQYVSLTSFKRDGTGVATPVWFLIENGRLLIHTDPQSFRPKRIRRNQSVMVAPCSGTGRLRGEDYERDPSGRGPRQGRRGQGPCHPGARP